MAGYQEGCTLVILLTRGTALPPFFTSPTLIQQEASLTSSTPTVNQLQQFGVDGLPGLLQHPDELAGLPEVPWGEESVRSAFVGAAGRAADTMDVILRRVGIVIVDDKLDILHILIYEAVKGGEGVVCWDQLQGGKRQKHKSEQT